MAPKKPTVTNAGSRSERVKGRAGGSKPSPRPTKVPAMKPQGPIAKAPRTTADTRNPTKVRAGLNQSNKPGAGRITGTMGRPKPANPPKVTTGKPTPVKLPNLPKNPVRGGTSQTIRATGGNSSSTKVNRLSAQAQRMTNRAAAGYGKASPMETGLKGAGSAMAYAVAKPYVDEAGRRAGRALGGAIRNAMTPKKKKNG